MPSGQHPIPDPKEAAAARKAKLARLAQFGLDYSINYRGAAFLWPGAAPDRWP